MNIGDHVRYRIHASKDQGQYRQGRIVAVEDYTDFHGTRRWIYVRWYCVDGQPSDNQMKHHESELEALP